MDCKRRAEGTISKIRGSVPNQRPFYLHGSLPNLNTGNRQVSKYNPDLVVLNCSAVWTAAGARADVT